METINKINRRDFIRYATLLGLAPFITLQESKAFSSQARGKIVIIGGGAAGISMAARLKRWLKEPDITIIDPSDRQYYQPGFTLVASGVYNADEVWKKQESCIPKGVVWIQESVIAVDPVKNEVTTTGNRRIVYDFLVLASGLQINWNHVEGITYDTLGQGNAHSIYDFTGAQKTWQAIQEFSKTGGVGLFTDTYTKYKCGGAPKKICLLAEHFARKQGIRDNIDFHFYTASQALYSTPYYAPRLNEIFRERDISVDLTTRVKGIDTASKEVYFEKTETGTGSTIITPFKEHYDFLHFVPPMSAPDFIHESGLDRSPGQTEGEGWVSVDKNTLVHTLYPNIVSLGDCSSLPTSKTSAAIRAQVPVAAKNLISIMEGKEPQEIYDGYAACPIITGYGHVLMCEFDYDKNRKSTFPFSMMDMSRESYLAWLVKVYALKPLFFHGMLKGYA